MKTTKKDYELFKSECYYWLKRFELNDTRIYFEWKDLGTVSAQTAGNISGNLTFAISTNIEHFQRTGNEEIRYLAKHEVMHGLLSRFSSLANWRHSGKEELEEEEERLVRKLVNIIL